VDQLLDFSASINPLGLPPGVETAIHGALRRVVHYPDPENRALQSALAGYHGLPHDCVLVGNGSTELIYLLARALSPRRALVLHPAFSEYEAALELVGSRIERVILSEGDGFLLRLSSLGSALGGQELVILANPGNPSGQLIPTGDLLRLAEACETTGGVLVVDEAFIDFVEEASLKRHLERFPRLCLLRSLTKFFALPGLRIGYALGAPGLLGRLRPWQEPWSVNTLAEAAGIAALEDSAYQLSSRLLIPRWREALATGLQKFEPVRVFPSAANYLLLKLLEPTLTAPRLREALLKERIAIRDCSSFLGLGPAHVRLAVRRPEENQTLLHALVALLG
jgi:threonine-phosphate decarboxylase